MENTNLFVYLPLSRLSLSFIPILILFVSLPLVFPTVCMAFIGDVSFGIGEKLVAFPTFTPHVLLEKLDSVLVDEMELIFAPVVDSLFTSAVSLVSEFKVAV